MDTQNKVIACLPLRYPEVLNCENTTIYVIIIMSVRALDHYGHSCQINFPLIVLAVLLQLVSSSRLCPAFCRMKSKILVKVENVLAKVSKYNVLILKGNAWF